MNTAIAIAQQTIDYNDSSNPLTVLQNTPGWLSHANQPNALFPGSTTMPLSSNNTLNIDFSALQTAPEYIYGGIDGVTGIAGVHHNTINFISGDFIAGNDIVGGFANGYDVNLTFNSVNIYGGTIQGGVIGASGSTHNNVVGTANLEANNNEVNIYGGELTAPGFLIIGGGVVALSIPNGSSTANFNRVNIHGGTLRGSAPTYVITAGMSATIADINAVAQSTGNILNVTAGDLSDVEGMVSGYAEVQSYTPVLNTSTAQANENQINISGGVVRNISAALFGAVLNNADSTAYLYGNNNIVNISGGDIQGDVHGSIGGFRGNAGSLHLQANHNIMNISGTATFSSLQTSLYGAGLIQGLGPFTGTILSKDLFTGNTLNWSAKTPAKLHTLANFEHINFTLNPAYANTNISLITAQNIVLGAHTDNISDGSITPSKISVIGIHSGPVLRAGDQFILMQATHTMTGNGIGITSNNVAQQGISLLYDVQTEVDTDNKIVTATILGYEESGEAGESNGSGGSWGYFTGGVPAVRVNPQLKALSEGYLAGAQLVIRGADLMAGDAFSAIHEQNSNNGWVPFVVASGQHNRYNSGAHITSDDFLLTGGLSYRQNHFIAGILLEAGWGNYDTYNSFYNTPRVKGTGDSHYYGLGILGRYDFNNNLYADTSVRFGRNRNTFHTFDIQNAVTGTYANYATESNYVSAHIGAGYLIKLNDKNSLDLSAKYLWTRLEGNNTRIAGDDIHFDRINSQRSRIHAKLNHQYSQSLTLTAGIGYEYEFDGKARATTYDVYNIGVPRVKGGTGMLSLGASIKPMAHDRLSLDIKVNGYIGQRESVGIGLRINYLW